MIGRTYCFVTCGTGSDCRQELGVRCERTGEEVNAVALALIFFFLPPSGTIGLLEDFFS